MAIERLKHLRLAAIKSERPALMRELMLLGCLYIKEPDGVSTVFKRESAGFENAKSEYERLLQAVGISDAYAPPILGLFTRKQKIAKSELFDDSQLEAGIQRADAIISDRERISAIDAEESRINEKLDKLRPWAPLDFPLELSETEHCIIIKGFLPASSDFVSLATEIRVRVPESQMIKASSDRNGAFAILIAMKNNCAKVLETADRYGFRPVFLENIRGSSADNIAVLRKELAALEDEKRGLVSDVRGDAASRSELKLCTDRQLVKKDLTENSEKLLSTYMTVNLEGWFPAEEEKNLLALLRRFACAWEITELSDAEMALRFSGKVGKEGMNAFMPLACRTVFLSLTDERDA